MSAFRSAVEPIILGFAIAILAVFGVGALILWGSPTPVTKNQEIIVATGNWPPYIERNNAGSKTDGQVEHGPLAAFVTEMFRLAGYKIKLQFYGWEKALNEVEAGKALAAFPYAHEADIPNNLKAEKRKRTDRFWFTDSIFPFAHVLYYKRGNVSAAKLARWVESDNPKKRYRLGRIKGYALWPRIVGSVKEIKSFDDIEDAFEALDKGEIDLLPESPHVGAMFLRTRGPKQNLDAKKFGYYWSPEGVMAGSTLTLHVLTPRNRKGLQLRNQLNAAIATLAKQGRLAELRSSFFEWANPRWKERTRGKIRVMTVAREFCQDDKVCRRFVLAPGTSAVVLIWPPLLTEPITSDSPPPDAENQEYLVKIKSGPDVNRLMYVPIKAFELTSQGE